MKLGEKIKKIRKENNLSQEEFSEKFKVTRQTVSSWENKKSYPDLETIMKLSEDYKISVDELLKGDEKVVKQIDSEKKQKKIMIRVLIIVLVSSIVLSVAGFIAVKKMNHISFEMQQDKTMELQTIKKESLVVGTGYFSLPKKGKVTFTSKGEIDTGELEMKVLNKKTNVIVYQIKRDRIKDQKTIFLEKGSYEIQITANEYKEKIMTYSYDLKIANE
ncbi:helix-turn-helix domain-containing protein [Vagococcus sp.]|uniref:helix-turn-helix domain-containing protein n=1 Tax=Vagococcus sp. TaxID=1933889 RepID=UPI003F956525